VCQKFCDNKEDAEEVVQDTFVIAFKKAGELRSDTLMGYLRKIAIHESLRKRNANLRLQNYVVALGDEQAEYYPELNTDFLPEAYLQNKESRIALLQIIKSLPKMQWKMIYMYYYAGFNTPEIAQLLGCTANNVRQTLHTARNAIKGKLVGTDKKTTVVSLSALLFMEEQVFAAGYVGAGVVGNAAIATAKSVKGYIIAVCVVAVCSVSIAVYFALLPNAEEHEPHDPTYQIYAELPVSEPESPLPNAEEPTEDQVPEDQPYTPYVPEAYEAEPYAPLVEVEPYEPQAAEAPVYIPQPVEPPETVEALEYEPGEIYEDIAVYEPLIQEEPYVPQAEEEPVAEDEPYESEPIDRTPEILAALAAANTVEDVTSIIDYYGFMFATQIHMDMRYRFYVLDDGSGDILIGMAAYADGTGWHMQFAHYVGGTMPLDMLQLLRFMEE